MDPKKPPAPRRVWRMTTDAPQGEFIDLTEPVDTPQPLVIKRTFHPEKRVFAKGVSAEALPAPVDSTGAPGRFDDPGAEPGEGAELARLVLRPDDRTDGERRHRHHPGRDLRRVVQFRIRRRQRAPLTLSERTAGRSDPAAA